SSLALCVASRIPALHVPDSAVVAMGKYPWRILNPGGLEDRFQDLPVGLVRHRIEVKRTSGTTFKRPQLRLQCRCSLG
ncbi:MAG TPA: hypothetical protein PLZ55_17700, partial [bacterium]|nr:hypothetical protein [bacterium]